MNHSENAGEHRQSSPGASHRKSIDTVLTEDTDSFMVGDSVFVKGTMAGRIAYIGETGLGAGDWAGVVLDEPIGKNDGTVGGHHYFQCEPRHGVFSRLHRLSRRRLGPTPELRDLSPERRFAGSRRESRSSPARRLSPNASPRASPGPRHSESPRHSPARQLRTADTHRDGPSRASPVRVVFAERRSSEVQTPSAGHARAAGQTTVRRHSESPAGHAHHHPVKAAGSHAQHSARVAGSPAAKVGDRVSVASASGRKQGVLRYLGTTGFAEGHWAGIELDEPRGRNNGTVAGTWYFECRPEHGLFAPSHKVTRLSAGAATHARAAPDQDGFF